jgi:hypothetical protein
MLNADVNAGISELETSDLPRQYLTLGAECAAREGDDGAGVVTPAAVAGGNGDERENCRANFGSHEGASLRRAAIPS